MALGANLPVESIGDLAQTVRAERAKLASELDALRARVERDPEFTGNAADGYDAFIAKWRTGQEQILQGLDGAADLLQKFHSALVDLGLQVTQNFNV